MNGATKETLEGLLQMLYDIQVDGDFDGYEEIKEAVHILQTRIHRTMIREYSKQYRDQKRGHDRQ